jgi:hypothetical protein
MTGAKREHLTTGQSDEARTACMACNCKPLAFFQARSTPTPGAQCLMLAAAAAAAVFACERRRPGPAGQSSSSRSLAAAGLLEWQASRSAAWRLELESKLLPVPSSEHQRPSHRIAPHHHHGQTDLLVVQCCTRVPIQFRGQHHIHFHCCTYTNHTIPAQKEMGALQVTVLAGIRAQPGSLSV